MNELPTNGTFRLDGMLQGSFPGDADTASDVQAWVGFAKAVGLFFHLRVEGGNYSLVADAAVRKISSLKGEDVESVIVDKLQALLDLLPPEMRSRSFSTIRSEEFREGTAVQTIYTVGRDGQISSEQRVVDIETAAAEPEITPASLRRAFLPTLVVITLTLFVSTFFIDYRRLITDARDRIMPLKEEELSLTQELAENYITFELNKLDHKKNILFFSLERGAKWEAAMESKPADSMEMDWKEFNTLMAIQKGRCRITFLDKKGKPLASREIDVRGLQEKKKIEVRVAYNSDERISKAVLGW